MSDMDGLIRACRYYWEKGTTLKYNRDLTVSPFNCRVVKKEHDQVNFQILYSVMYSKNTLRR